jgi:hypothetical protein
MIRMTRLSMLLIPALWLAPPAMGQPEHAGPPEHHDGMHRAMVDGEPAPLVEVAYLGVSAGPIDPALAAHVDLPEGVGLVVNFVSPDSPAADAGIRRHDILHKLNDQMLVNPDQLRVLVRSNKPGQRVELRIIRQGKPITIQAELGQHLAPQRPTRAVRGDGPAFGPRPIDRGPMDAPPPGLMPGHHRDDAQLIVSQARTTLDDGEHRLTIRVHGGKLHLRAEDNRGRVLFNGPIETAEQRQRIPEPVRMKLQKHGLEDLHMLRTDRGLDELIQLRIRRELGDIRQRIGEGVEDFRQWIAERDDPRAVLERLERMIDMSKQESRELLRELERLVERELDDRDTQRHWRDDDDDDEREDDRDWHDDDERGEREGDRKWRDDDERGEREDDRDWHDDHDEHDGHEHEDHHDRDHRERQPR